MDNKESPPLKTIVHVDNDPLFLHAIREILVSKGYEVSLAKDGLEGLHLIRKIKPDYIILDIVMPKLDGGRLCAEIRRTPRLQHIPIIVFSSLSPREYRHFPRLGADAYVAKGPLEKAAENILQALRHFDTESLEAFPGPIVGFEGFQPKRLDNELLLERSFFKAIVEAIAPGALVLDPLGDILVANHGAVEILGMTESSLIGKRLAALVMPSERAVLQELLAELMKATQPAHSVVPFHLEDLTVSARVAPVLEQGKCMGCLVLLEKTESVAEEQ